MNINLELFKVFYIVASQNSITKASKILYISQPAVSKLIGNLEKAIGITLFYRTSKGVALTPNGHALYNYLEHALVTILNVENIISKISNNNCGSIKVAINSTLCKFYFIPRIAQFINLYPKIKINLVNCSTYESLNLIYTGKVDFAIISPIDNIDNYSSYKLLDVHDIFICSPGFIKYNSVKTPLDFNNLEYLMLPNANNSSRLIYDGYFNSNNFSVSPFIELATMDLLIDLCRNDLGITIASKEFIEDDIKNGTLIPLNTSISLPERSIYIVSNPKIPYTNADIIFENYFKSYDQ